MVNQSNVDRYATFGLRVKLDKSAAASKI